MQTSNRMGTCPFRRIATIPVVSRPLQVAVTPDSSSLAISPDGAFAYIVSFTQFSPAIAKVDLATRKIVQTIPARGAYPQNAILSPDGEQLYVTYPYLDTVSIIDTETFSEVMALTIRAPRGIAFNSKGTKAYIASTDNAYASFSPGTVQQLNTTTFKIENTYKIGVGPSDVYVLYSDQFVIVNNYEGQSISKIDTVSGTVTTTAVQGRPSGISLVN